MLLARSGVTLQTLRRIAFVSHRPQSSSTTHAPRSLADWTRQKRRPAGQRLLDRRDDTRALLAGRSRGDLLAAPTSISPMLATASLCARSASKTPASAFVIWPAIERTIPLATQQSSGSGLMRVVAHDRIRPDARATCGSAARLLRSRRSSDRMAGTGAARDWYRTKPAMCDPRMRRPQCRSSSHGNRTTRCRS